MTDERDVYETERLLERLEDVNVLLWISISIDVRMSQLVVRVEDG